MAMPDSSLQAFERKKKALLLNKMKDNPAGIATYTQLSKKVSAKLQSFVVQGSDLKILEIGIGCGRLSHELLQAGFAARNLAIMESDFDLFQLLKETFKDESEMSPHQIFHGDACDLSHKLPEGWLGNVDVVISTIPLFSVEEGMRREIVKSCMQVLSHQGKMLHVTYGHMSPIYFMKDINQKKLASTWWNVPPAFIWQFLPKRDSLSKAA